MFRLTQSLIQEFQDQNISELTVRIVSGGCAGNKMEVLTSRPEDIQNFEYFSEQKITIFIPKDQTKKLTGGLLTRGPKNWIFTHPDIKSRCGCAKSFSYEEKGKIASLHVLKDLKKMFVSK